MITIKHTRVTFDGKKYPVIMNCNRVSSNTVCVEVDDTLFTFRTGQVISYKHSKHTWMIASVRELGLILMDANTSKNMFYSWPNLYHIGVLSSQCEVI